MYSDILHFVHNCSDCAIVSGGGKLRCSPLNPILIQCPFQIVGVDIMDLPKTNGGNTHVLMFQDFLTKWPLVFSLPDQTTFRVTKILVEVFPFLGVPERII